MVQITIDLVRRKAEHNAGSLDDLEELSLHQLNLDGINGVLGNTTRKLRILYLQNNFIPRLENLHKLTRLEYLNVALNSIARVEGLESCESLRKLDLTVNFIDSPTLLESLRALAACESLREVYLTGNPCTTFDGYRALVIALVPQLTKLDGEEISRSERIVARQRLPALLASLEEDAARKQLPRDGSVAEVKGDDERKGEEYTRETRMAMLREIEEERRREEAKAREAQARRLQDDPWKAAQLKLAVKVQAPEDGSLPPQRNVGKLEFTLQEDEARGAVEASVAVPKFLDSSAIDVDVHPRWFQLVFQGHALLLHFPSEVSSDRARVRRMPTSGKLVITVPTVAGPRAGAAATASPAAALKPASAKSERDRARVRYHPRRRHPAHDDDDDAAAGEAAAPAEDKAARVSAVAAAIGVDESEVPPLE